MPSRRRSWTVIGACLLMLSVSSVAISGAAGAPTPGTLQERADTTTAGNESTVGTSSGPISVVVPVVTVVVLAVLVLLRRSPGRE